ncbi:MAG: hypothetical protein ABIA12_02730 [Candidatus Aenigmatarchaeota archaeon]
MAEVDWDKIIRAAQSKKKDAEKREDIEKRLKRMESMMRKAASEKEAAAARAERPTEHVSRKDSIRRALRLKGAEEDKLLARLERLERLEHDLGRPKSAASADTVDVPRGFKIVRVPRRSRIRIGAAGKAVSDRLSAGAKALFSNRRNAIAIVGVLVVIAISALYFTGNFNLPDISGLTGLLAGKPKVTYVCADGVTTVENVTMCPTTTTIATTTTLPATTTTTTTLPPCAGNYCVYLKQLTCSGSTINAVLVNSGSKSFAPDPNGGPNPIMLLKFLLDGAEKPFVCSPILVSIGAETTCMYTTPTVGTFNIEVRGVSIGNIEKGTVTC